MLVVVGRPSGSVARAVLGALARLPGPKRIVSDAAAGDCDAAPGFETVTITAGDTAAAGIALEGARHMVILPRFERAYAQCAVALVRAARAAGVERIVQISLIGASPRSPVELLRLLGSIEQAVVQSGVVHAIYRCTAFIQAVEHFLRAEPERLRLVGPFRAAQFAWIDAADVGEIVARGLAEPLPESIVTQLCGDEILDFDALAAAVASGTGRCCEYVEVTPPAAHGMLEAQGMPAANARALVEYWDFIVSGVVCTTPCDNARRLLGRPLRKVTESFAAQGRLHSFTGG